MVDETKWFMIAICAVAIAAAVLGSVGKYSESRVEIERLRLAVAQYQQGEK